MKVVITAGGKGTRIREVAGEIPKAMLPVAGKPVLEYQVELAKKYGFKEFIFLIGYLGEQIEKYFGKGSKFGVNIDYYHEIEPLGTAGAFKEIEHLLTEDFWVFYGDTVMDIDMPRMLDFHRQKQGDATLFLHPNDHPYDSDLVDIDENQKVTAFYSKPHDISLYYRNLVNAALYILSPKMLDYIPKGKKNDFGKNIFPTGLVENAVIYGYVSPEYVKDMGTPERYNNICNDITSGKVARLNINNPRPAIFLDRDGVISKEVNLLAHPDQLELLPGAAEAIKKINKSGYLVVIITNQPVIARNLCTMEGLRQIHNKLETLLGQEHAYLDAIYFCPHHPDKGYPEERKEYKIDCECRKPKPGMLFNAKCDLNIDMSQSFMIGDREVDAEAGLNAGVKQTFIIAQNEPNALLNIVDNIIYE
jgi:D,D-heptose 1,7-bisphosphate phosphatase